MPRFFLHVFDGNIFAEDREGLDLPDVAAAREEAVEGLRDMLAGDLRGGHLNTAASIRIEDEGHQLVGTVSFADAVQVSDEISSKLNS